MSPRHWRREYARFSSKQQRSIKVNNYTKQISEKFSMFSPMWDKNFDVSSEVPLESLSFALYVNRQRKISRYQAIKSKWTCCFKTEIHNYSFDARKKIRNENIQRKFCQENLYMSFAVHGNVKLKLPNGMGRPGKRMCFYSKHKTSNQIPMVKLNQ
jgi:hypothetical protein